MGARSRVDSRTVTLTSANPTADLVHLTYADSDESEGRQFTLRVQVPSVALGIGSSGGPVNVALTITEISGGVPLVRGPFIIRAGSQRRYKSSADAVVVTVALVGGTPGSSPPTLATATVSGWLRDAPSGQGGDDLMWTQGTPLRGVLSGQVWTGAATVGQGHCTIKVTPGAVVWLLLFDSVGAPTAGTPPLAMGVSDGMQNAGDSVSLEDEFEPGTLAVQNGLWASLSTDPTQLALPAAGSAEIDMKVGL